MGIQSELHQNIQDRFNEAGVEIMSPTYAALRDGNQVTIPNDYLPKTYEAQGFKIASLPALLNLNK
jgi:small-conductance mechanosensitive channel